MELSETKIYVKNPRMITCLESGSRTNKLLDLIVVNNLECILKLKIRQKPNKRSAGVLWGQMLLSGIGRWTSM